MNQQTFCGEKSQNNRLDMWGRKEKSHALQQVFEPVYLRGGDITDRNSKY